MRETEREAETLREKQAPCRKLDVGLDPRTPGSHPEPKTDTQPLSHPGVPILQNSYLTIVVGVGTHTCFTD